MEKGCISNEHHLEEAKGTRKGKVGFPQKELGHWASKLNGASWENEAWVSLAAT